MEVCPNISIPFQQGGNFSDSVHVDNVVFGLGNCVHVCVLRNTMLSDVSVCLGANMWEGARVRVWRGIGTADPPSNADIVAMDIFRHRHILR